MNLKNIDPRYLTQIVSDWIRAGIILLCYFVVACGCLALSYAAIVMIVHFALYAHETWGW